MTTLLEQRIPEAQVRTAVSRTVHAPIEATWAALTSVSVEDLTLGRMLLSLRRGMRSSSGPHGPLVEAGPVPMMVYEPPQYCGGLIAVTSFVGGHETAHLTSMDGSARYLHEPGWLVAGIEFCLRARAGDTAVRTTTLVHASDADTLRSFKKYWLAVAPFSAVLRHDLLRTIANRASAAAQSHDLHRVPRSRFTLLRDVAAGSVPAPPRTRGPETAHRRPVDPTARHPQPYGVNVGPGRGRRIAGASDDGQGRAAACVRLAPTGDPSPDSGPVDADADEKDESPRGRGEPGSS